MRKPSVDFAVIGGGFFGCCLALFLKSVSKNVVLIERGDRVMRRASLNNQARIHSGFHYPRSVLTACRSKILSQRFALDFNDAVARDFRMLYAISSKGSKVSAQRFFRFFSDMGAPIRLASPSDSALFNEHEIEEVFECEEWAFDGEILAEIVLKRLEDAGVNVIFNTKAEKICEEKDRVVVGLERGHEISTGMVFNVTYSEANRLLRRSGMVQAKLKHELAEIALIEPLEPLQGIGVTVMDGPFFSTMPYPASNCYSLTHVRYTPQLTWQDTEHNVSPYRVLDAAQKPSQAPKMISDARRFLPCLADARVKGSIFEIKTVLSVSEGDDSRPILFHRECPEGRVVTILGGKIDNIYDLFMLVRRTIPDCYAATDHLVRGIRAA